MDDLTEGQQDLILQHMAAVGHICYFCHRMLQLEDLITVASFGPLPVYSHTACSFHEEVAQQMFIDANNNFKKL